MAFHNKQRSTCGKVVTKYALHQHFLLCVSSSYMLQSMQDKIFYIFCPQNVLTSVTLYISWFRFIYQQNIPWTQNLLPQNDVKLRSGIQDSDFSEICRCIYIQISDKNSSLWCNTSQLGCCTKGSPILNLAAEYIWTNFILHTVSRQCASAMLCHQQSVCPFDSLSLQDTIKT